MLRKRQPTWIQRNSRFAIAAIATVGIVTTGYLTATRLLQAETICPIEGCDKVLESPYATIFGVVPLAAFGLLAYIAMLVMAIAPWILPEDSPKVQRSLFDEKTWLGLSIGATAMAVFSGYLMSIMIFEIQAFCLYCVVSAVAAISLFVLSLVGHDWDDFGSMGFRSVIIAAVTLVGSFALYAPLHADPDNPAGGFAISTQSQPANIELAQHLKTSEVAMYGAFWCNHCQTQKSLFGRQAFAEVEYIECDANGKNPQPARCQAAGIQSYPTWVVDGQQHQGVHSLEELAALSSYAGEADFGVE